MCNVIQYLTMSDSIHKEITPDGDSSNKNKQNDTKNKDKTLEKTKVNLDKLRKSQVFRDLGDQFDYWSD